MKRDIPPFPTNDPKEFDKLPEKQKQLILDWIEKNLSWRQTQNPKATVSWIRTLYKHDQHDHHFTEETYLTLDEIFGAMIASGFKHTVPRDTNYVAFYYFNAGLPKPPHKRNQ